MNTTPPTPETLAAIAKAGWWAKMATLAALISAVVSVIGLFKGQ